MKEADPRQMVNADATGVYKQFFDTLRLLKEVSDPSARRMWSDELRDLQLRAEKLLATGALHPNQHSQMTILLSRPAEQWGLLTKERPIVPTY